MSLIGLGVDIFLMGYFLSMSVYAPKRFLKIYLGFTILFIIFIIIQIIQIFG